MLAIGYMRLQSEEEGARASKEEGKRILIVTDPSIYLLLATAEPVSLFFLIRNTTERLVMGRCRW